MVLQNTNNKNKWYCKRCHTWNAMHGASGKRCGLCGIARPADEIAESKKVIAPPPIETEIEPIQKSAEQEEDINDIVEEPQEEIQVNNDDDTLPPMFFGEPSTPPASQVVKQNPNVYSTSRLEGTSPQYAIPLMGSDPASETYKHISRIMGDEDGDFFIMSEQVLEDKSTKRKYKVVFLKDKQEKPRSIYFLIG